MTKGGGGGGEGGQIPPFLRDVICGRPQSIVFAEKLNIAHLDMKLQN